MTRAVLVGLLVMASAVGDARADRLRADCGRGTVVIPHDGATDVPRNAKLWALGAGWGAGVEVGGPTRRSAEAKPVASRSTSIVVYDLGELARGSTHTVTQETDGQSVHFTTSVAFDTTAPQAPVIRRLAIAAALATDRQHEDVAEIDLDVTLDPDVILVRLEIDAEGVHTTEVMEPGAWRDLGRPACGTALRLSPNQHATFALTAIDVAGNESPRVTRDVVVTDGGPDLLAARGEFHVRCGMGALGVMFIGMIVTAIAFIVLLGLIIKHFARVRSLGAAVAVPLSMLAAERLARSAQRRSGLVAAVALVGVPAFFVGDNSGMSIVATVIGCIGLRGFFIARGILAMLDNNAAEVEALGHRLVVRIGDAESHLDLDEDKLARARRKFAIPPAKQT